MTDEIYRLGVTRMTMLKKLYLQAKALEAAQNGILITDPDGTIIYANTYASKMTQYPNEELIGANPRMLKSGKHPASFYKKMWDKISSGEKWQGELINKKKDNTIYSEVLTITPVTGGDGEIEFYIGIQQEVSNNKKNLRETTEDIKSFLEKKKK